MASDLDRDQYSSEPDPTFVNSRREAIVIFCTWFVALIWAVTYCKINGYDIEDPANIPTSLTVALQQQEPWSLKEFAARFLSVLALQHSIKFAPFQMTLMKLFQLPLLPHLRNMELYPPFYSAQILKNY